MPVPFFSLLVFFNCSNSNNAFAVWLLQNGNKQRDCSALSGELEQYLQPQIETAALARAPQICYLPKCENL
jgi:hypothetical protein